MNQVGLTLVNIKSLLLSPLEREDFEINKMSRKKAKT